MNTETEIHRIKQLIDFQREKVIPSYNELFMSDKTYLDENKLPALEKLLLKMHEFKSELENNGIKLSKNNDDNKLGYDLNIPKFSKKSNFTAEIFSDWFDLKKCFALHSGFEFTLRVNQRIHPEIGDWIFIGIKNFNTTPFALGSFCNWSGGEHLPNFYSDKKFFTNIKKRLGNEFFPVFFEPYSFKIDLFNKAVDDACIVMDELLSYKGQLIL